MSQRLNDSSRRATPDESYRWLALTNRPLMSGSTKQQAEKVRASTMETLKRHRKRLPPHGVQKVHKLACSYMLSSTLLTFCRASRCWNARK